MALNLTTLVLVAAITFMHSIFGFFSGVINVFCTVISVSVALGFYEALNNFVTSQVTLHPAYTEPACLMVLFIATIIVTRTLADNYIRGNVKVPAVVDWGGGAVCGFINAQLFVGMIVLGVSMLPLGGRVLQFSRYDRDPYEKNAEHPELPRFDHNHLWTRSDEFTVALFNMLSSGSLKGSTAFASVYPRFCDDIFFSTNTVQEQSSPTAYRDSKAGDGFKNGLKVDKWWEETAPVETRYREEVPSERNPTPALSRVTFKPAGGMKLIGVRLTLNKSAADVQDRIYRHLFRPTMLRLVGTRGGKPQDYVARILANADKNIGEALRLVDYDDNFSLEASGNVSIDAYFEVDDDFVPHFVEYRRHARAALPPESKQVPKPLQVAEAAAGHEHAQPSESSGKRSFGTAMEGGSGDSPKLPFIMNRRALQGAGADVRLKDDKFAVGRIAGARSTLEIKQGETGVIDFWVPEGQRLMQVRYEPKRARTVFGDVFNYVGQLNQFQLVDRNANTYPLAGYYAIVKRSRGEFIELFYAGDPDDPAAISATHMLDFKSVDRQEINDRDGTTIGLLFLVPPNTEFVRIQNQAGDGAELSLRSGG